MPRTELKVCGGWWWWLRPILVLSLSLDQAEQFLTEWKYEYIHQRKFHWIQILNTFISWQLTKYKYKTYWFLATGQIWISNIFVARYLTKYEYWVYLFWAIWTDMNIEYVECKLLMTPYSKFSTKCVTYLCIYIWAVSNNKIYHTWTLKIFVFRLLTNTNITHIFIHTNIKYIPSL